MADKLITILTVTYPHELAVIRSRFESEGIEYSIKDEITASMYPIAVGGVKLQVKESDLEKAVTLLKETGAIKDSDTES